jgi:phosphate-selective porin OprO and OprP
MRHTKLSLAMAIALGGLSLSAHADSRDQELAELKAQLQALSEKVEALEAQAEAQSDVNVDAATQITDLKNSTPKVETKGGLKVTAADGKAEFALSGRVHFDTFAWDRDIAPTTGTTEFRRARLTLAGKVSDWEYKVEQDFAAGTNLEGLRDAFIATNALGGKITIGQFKPYRSMEELTSSNEILMMERPFSSATGIFSGRQHQQGVGYLRAGDNYTLGLSASNLRSAASPRNEGVGFAGRFTFAPINSENSTLHLGLSYSTENNNAGSPNLVATANYAGRRGPAQTIATTTGASGDTVDMLGAEIAGSFGPVFFQGEYFTGRFNGPLVDNDVDSWYLQGSWILNGGHKPYKGATGVFGSPKVGESGLWELTARYDTIDNKDVANREVNSWIIGMNYYLNPNLRFMFNYTKGENEANGDETGQYALRTQFTF